MIKFFLEKYRAWKKRKKETKEMVEILNKLAESYRADEWKDYTRRYEK